MSHQNGIVGTGRIKIVENPQFPPNEMFVAGKEFPCRLRHATVRFLDDAGLIPRAASLKFADSDNESPLDLLMNTGVATPFNNVKTFWEFMRTSIAGGRVKSIAYLQNNPRCFMNFKRAVRRNPVTFAQMYYHTQTIFEFHALDGKRRYARFRLIPEDRGAETGIPNHDDLETVWFQEALPGETRSRNYLKDEYRERVKNKGVTYHLQMQVHEWQHGDRPDLVMNSIYEWSERSHPWLDIAHVRIDGILEKDGRKNAPLYSIERGDHCLFSLANHPDCLQFMKPSSVSDPASLDYLRRGGVWARKARLLSMRLFGPDEPIADEREPQNRDDESQSVIRADDVYMVASLPQSDNRERIRERRQQLEIARGQYQFWDDGKMPPRLKNLPAQEELTLDRQHRMHWDIAKSELDLGLAEAGTWFHDYQGLEVYGHLYPILDVPTVIDRFKSDEEFGRQRLDGVNTGMIFRCRELPDAEKFPLDHELTRQLLDGGDTLDAAVESGRVYMLDYHEMQGLPCRDECYITAPICLLYVGKDGRLKPIAIQLGQSPDDGPVFTPKDDFWLWQTVKTHVQSVDGQYQESIAHLLLTHEIVETIGVSTHRQLHIGHPVHKLLLPHLRFTMAINHTARAKLLATGGPIDKVFSIGASGCKQLISKVWKSSDWTFANYDLERDLARRGVADESVLPNYHYRDDARLVRGAIEEFVTDVIRFFYSSDQDVTDDFEIQGWAAELCDPEGGNIVGFPASLATVDELIQLLTTIIFTASAGHSCTNGGQYDLYGYIPNVPGAMYAPPPKTKEPLTEESLAEALPKGMSAADQIATAHLLSEPTDSPIGHYGTSFFAGHSEILAFIKKFQRNLDSVSASIEARNSRLDVPYDYLNPKNIFPSAEI